MYLCGLKIIGFLVCLGLSSWGLAAQVPVSSSSPTDDLDNSIAQLEKVSQQLEDLQISIANSKQVIASLQADSTASQVELQKQRDLLDANTTKLATLSKNYAGLLELCKRLKLSLQLSQTVNKVAIPLGVAAVITAVIVVVTTKK